MTPKELSMRETDVIFMHLSMQLPWSEPLTKKNSPIMYQWWRLPALLLLMMSIILGLILGTIQQVITPYCLCVVDLLYRCINNDRIWGYCKSSHLVVSLAFWRSEAAVCVSWYCWAPTMARHKGTACECIAATEHKTPARNVSSHLAVTPLSLSETAPRSDWSGHRHHRGPSAVDWALISSSPSKKVLFRIDLCRCKVETVTATFVPVWLCQTIGLRI